MVMSATSKRTLTLADALGVLDDPEAESVRLSGAALDSRDVEPGHLFMALAGQKANGLNYVDDAADRGAAAIVLDRSERDVGQSVTATLPVRHIANLAAQAGEIAARVYNRPSETLFTTGITGTDGKTTCAWLLATALSRAGSDCGYIGTLGAGRVGPTMAGLGHLRHTTPDSATLQRECARLRDTGAAGVAIEVSSHALAQHRSDSVVFDVGVLTGIGRDHLDYHGDHATYVAAKRRLFDHPKLSAAVINADDAIGHRWLPELSERLSVTGFGVDPALKRLERYVHITRLTPGQNGLSITLSTHLGEVEIATRLLGFFNAANVAAVVAVLLHRGLGLAAIREALAAIGGAPGRMERIDTTVGQPTVVVDYAHNAGSLTQALIALDEHCRGRLILVFGCGGERDSGKRAAMGRAAATYGDVVIVTDDNPRHESPEAIVKQIVSGLPSTSFQIIHDRAAAIAAGIQAARSEDIVFIAGKGHETTQQIGSEFWPFDDRDVARRALEAV